MGTTGNAHLHAVSNTGVGSSCSGSCTVRLGSWPPLDAATLAWGAAQGWGVARAVAAKRNDVKRAVKCILR